MFEYKAKVVRVIDGDTIEVMIDLGFYLSIREKVRLANINAYEIKLGKTTTQADKDKGLEAKAFLENMLADQEITLKTVKIRGKYGRFIANVFVDDNGMVVNVNDLLIQKGYAVKAEY